MKIVILGASGLVGSHVMAAATASGHDVVGTTRAASSPTLRQLELGEQTATYKLLEVEAPAVVVYSAGWTWVDGCEADPMRSRRENFELPLSVARWCFANKVHFLNYSTSYVFDGRSGPYAENDPVSPLNIYGRHKADAEKAILDATHGTALIPRLICVWGTESARKNFVYQILARAVQQAPMEVPSDQCGNPTWAGDIAYWSLSLLEASATGIWNLVGNHVGMTRVEWAQRILDGLCRRGIRPMPIVSKTTAELGQRALRPLHAGLCDLKIQTFCPHACREPDDIPETIA